MGTGGRATAARAELRPRDALCPRELYELMSASWRRLCSADCTVTPSVAPWAQPLVRDAVTSGDRTWVLPSWNLITNDASDLYSSSSTTIQLPRYKYSAIYTPVSRVEAEDGAVAVLRSR